MYVYELATKARMKDTDGAEMSLTFYVERGYHIAPVLLRDAWKLDKESEKFVRVHYEGLLTKDEKEKVKNELEKKGFVTGVKRTKLPTLQRKSIPRYSIMDKFRLGYMYAEIAGVKLEILYSLKGSDEEVEKMRKTLLKMFYERHLPKRKEA